MEIFSTVSGAISLAALFNSCVESFRYIQLARHFGKDFERCQLKLDIARLRLTRWGQATAIFEDFNSATTAERPDEVSRQQVGSILEEIVLLFQSIEKTSGRYEMGAKPGQLARFEDAELGDVSRKLHSQMANVSQKRQRQRQRQRQASFVQKAKWALYDAKQFDKLLGQLTGFIDDLEKLFPADETRRCQLAEMEIEEINDVPSLLALKDAAEGTDDVLEKAVGQKAEGFIGKNSADHVMTWDQSRVRIGNEWTERAVAGGSGITDKTANAVESVTARGSSGVHIGNSYGGPGIFG